MKAKVDPDICVGSALCAETCPEVFGMDEKGISAVKVDEVPEDAKKRARQAEEECPAGAITIEEQ